MSTGSPQAHPIAVNLPLMGQPVDVQRKLRQLDGDVQSIYEMLAGITGTQERHGNRLNELAEQLDLHGGRLNDMSEQLELHGEQLRNHGEQLRDHGEQLRSHGEQLRSHGERLVRMDTKLDTILRLLTTGDEI